MQLTLDINNFNLIIFFIFAIIFGCSMYGWSHIFFFKTISKYISLNVTIGMAITLFIGGILNFLNLAYQNTLDIIFFIGVILFIIKVYKIQLNIKSLNFIKDINKNYFFFLLPILLLFLNIISSINPEAYNYHDDFETYFIHPIKMLETGSVFGSTLGAAGTRTFGGQAFFQSFYINWLGLNAINIFDSVFCLCLCVFLIIEWTIEKKILKFGALIATLLILIHPQFTNISSVYSAVLFMATIIILSTESFRDQSSQNFNYFKFILGISLSLASLFVLKTTYGLFSFIFYILFLSFYLLFCGFNKNLLKFIILTPLLSLMIAVPWIIFSVKKYLTKVEPLNDLQGLSLDTTQFFLPNLISIKPLFYGGTLSHYTFLVLIGIIFIISTFSMIKKKRLEHQGYDKGILIVSSVALFSGFIIYFIFILLTVLVYAPLNSTIRYSIPFIIATIPLGLLMCYSIIPTYSKYVRVALYIIIITFIISFLPEYKKRILQSYKCGSQLSFSSFACSKDYISYNKKVFDKKKKLLVQKWQNEIPESESIMIWISTPFYLDFKRNNIIEIDIGGLDNSWAVFPSANYFIWEYASFSTRSIKDLKFTANNAPLYDKKDAIAALKFIQKINNMLRLGKIKILKKDESVIIFRIL